MVKLTYEGKIDFNSKTPREMLGMAVHAPSVLQYLYNERSILCSYAHPGWIDDKTQQGPDLLNLFSTLKREFTVKEKNKWIDDQLQLICFLHGNGHFSEELF